MFFGYFIAAFSIFMLLALYISNLFKFVFCFCLDSLQRFLMDQTSHLLHYNVLACMYRTKPPLSEAR